MDPSSFFLILVRILLTMVEERICHAHPDINISPTRSSLEISEKSNSHPTYKASNKGASETSSEFFEYAVLSIFDFHYLTQAIENGELLRKLYLEMKLSRYQISEISGWSRTCISGALKSHGIKQIERTGPNPQYGMQKIGTKHLIHKGEQKIIKKIMNFYSKSMSYRSIAEMLSKEKIPSKSGKKWNKTTVADIIKRELKRKV